MKVLGVFGGIDLPEAHLLCGLKKAGIELLLFCHRDAEHQEMLQRAGVRITHLKLKSKVCPSGVLAIRKAVFKEKPDIVHAFTARALSNIIFAVSLMHKRPKIVAYRGAVGNISKWDPTSWISYLNPKVDAISCVSEAVQRYLLEVGVEDEKLQTIYKGHDCSWYPADPPELSREDLGIAENSLVFGCVANMRPSKGVDILCRAIERINKDLAIHFLLIGQMTIPPKLKARDNVSVLGFRSDAQALMQLFDVVVVPSRREGLPKSLLEAMSQGIAPIVTDAGGMPEIVRNGVDGIVVSIADVSSLRRAIEELASDREKLSRFKEAAKKRVVERFSISNTVEQTASLYNSLLGS